MEANSPKPYTFDRVVRIIIGISVFVGIFLILKKLSPVLLPFFIGWLIAYLLHPMVEFFQYKLKFKNRVLAIITTLILVLGSFTGIFLILLPIISNEVAAMGPMIESFSSNFDLTGILPQTWHYDLAAYWAKVDLMSTLTNPDFQDFIKTVAPKLWDFLSNSINFVLGLMVMIVIFLYIIFILKDYEKIHLGWVKIIPIKYRPTVEEIYNDMVMGMNKYFRGQALIATIVGILFATGFTVIGLPMGLLFGLFVGILNLVPYLQAVATVPALFLIMLKSHETGASFGSVLLGVGIVFAIVQSFQDLVLVPKIMGKVTGLNPAIILLSLSIWGYLMGILGMIIALPLTTLVISYYRRWVLKE